MNIVIGYSLQEYIIGFIMAAIIIGLLIFYCVRTIKKGNKEFKEILDKIPKEDMDKLVVSGFQDYPENKKRLIGTGIVADIQKDSKKIKIAVVFYNSFFRTYMTNKVAVTTDFYTQKQLKVGDFVQTLHEKDKDNLLKIKEIL